jgi:ribosomal protein S18 acetylase RimI-like enzyme
MEPIEIHEVRVVELEDLVLMGRKSFLEAFTANNKIENVYAYLDEAFTLSQFQKEYLNPSSKFFIIKSEGRIVGFTKVNLDPAQTDIHDPESLEIARLYVLEEYLGIGFGKKLLEKAFTFAKLKGLKYVWLGVWEHNARAIKFYEKNGFAKFSTHPFPFGDEIQTDWLMKKDIG